MRQRLAMSAILAAALLLAMVAGCNGNGAASDGTQGRVSLLVTWPATRAIPLLGQSLRVTLWNDADYLDTRVINKPNVAPTVPTEVTFLNVPRGALHLRADVFDAPSLQGVKLATGYQTLLILPGQTASIDMDLQSTITTLAIDAPASIQVSKSQTLTLRAIALDADGGVVPGVLAWTSDAPGIASVDRDTGLLTGVQMGTTTIHVADTETHFTAALTVTVVEIGNINAILPNEVIGVAIYPLQPQVVIGKTLILQAAVQNSPNQMVVWSVREGSAGGAVTDQGVYTPPAVPGTYHVLATSVADPSKRAEVAVTVVGP